MTEHQTIAILDLEGRCGLESVRAVRERGVFSLIMPRNACAEEPMRPDPIGFVALGRPGAKRDALGIPESVLSSPAPVLFSPAPHDSESGLEFDGKTENGLPYILYGESKRRIYVSTVNTRDLDEFLFGICRAVGDWTSERFISGRLKSLRATIGTKKALCALSGGVDSAVTAMLMHKAIGPNLTCVFVNHGLLRKNEAEWVLSTFRDRMGMRVVYADASDRFIANLKGVADPERKRRIIGETFIRVFEEIGKSIGRVDYFAQGTIYPDIVESGLDGFAPVKSHHNVGGLPSAIEFDEIIEPLKHLFKDEVRKVGLALGLEPETVNRQPFPGPGLGIRVIGEITREKLDILRDADFVMRDEFGKAGLDKTVWQYFAVLTDARSVGVRDGKRTYERAVCLRAVNSVDAMTAEVASVPLDLLNRIALRIVREVKGVNRALFDITPKPPATIEWE